MGGQPKSSKGCQNKNTLTESLYNKKAKYTNFSNHIMIKFAYILAKSPALDRHYANIMNAIMQKVW